MKSQLIAIVAAVLLVGCGQSDHQHSHDDGHSHAEGDYDHVERDGHDHDKELKAAEPVAEAAKPEQPTAKAPDISIHYAANSGNIEAIKQHLAAGADVNAKDKRGTTPMHKAAGRGHKEIVELLIAEGADVNATDGDGDTPLHLAGNTTTSTEIAELLISKGADVNAMNLSPPGRRIGGMTPLDMATLGNRTEIADLLRKHGGKTRRELKAEGK